MKTPLGIFAAGLALCALVLAAPVFADDASDVAKQQKIQDALDNAGFGGTQPNPNADLALVSDRHSRTYSRGTDSTVKFKIRENQDPVPNAQILFNFNYYTGFSNETLIGLPPSPTDGAPTWPSEPSRLQNPYDIFNYSGDEWGDCLGPQCVERGRFRQPVGSWVHYVPNNTLYRNDLSNLIGFNDTLQQLRNELGFEVQEYR